MHASCSGFKMETANDYGERLLYIGLLWLALTQVLTVHVRGQQGASLELLGVNLPNDSLVSVQDLYNVFLRSGQVPTHGTDHQFPTLHCFTDLVDCCNTPRTSNLGEWYFPNGTALAFDFPDLDATFRRNRGPNGPYGPEGETILGVVRLFRRGLPPERGRFRCEIPTAAGVNQTLYVNILNIGPVTITASGGSNTGIVGTNFSLECSATVETQSDTPTPNFDWFFGTNNASVPSGATPMATVMDNIYTSTLQFSPLQESHAGMYICRLGSNARLAVNAMVTVNRGPTITATVRASGSPVLGQSGYSLTCDVTGDENLRSTRTYQWTRDNGNTQTQVGANSNTLSFSPLSLSDAGRYTCSVTVSSPYLSSDATDSSNDSRQIVQFQIPTPSVSVTSNPPSPILDGSNVIVTCTVEMGAGVVNSDLSLLMVDAQLSRDGTALTLTAPTVTGTTFTYTTQLNSFGRNDSGNYICTATVTQVQPPSTYITGSGLRSTVVRIVTVPLSPPVNVQATQSSASAPVEVSWSPPSSGPTNINAFRIFYGNGKNVSVSSVITNIGLSLNKDSLGETVSVRSESDQSFSELVTTTVTVGAVTCSCSSEVGISVGVTLLLACLIVAVVCVIVILCWKSSRKASSDSIKSEFAVSVNTAYSEVKIEPLEGEGGVYEDPDKMVSSGQRNTGQTDIDHESGPYQITGPAETCMQPRI